MRFSKVGMKQAAAAPFRQLENGPMRMGVIPLL
jgi:hypothetical protein